MTQVTSICVYCGSASGNDPAYAAAATALGQDIARTGTGLVYGGGRIGLMGLVADACLAGGGKVAGIIPGFLHQREIAHPYVTDLRIVDSMHERKQIMFDLSDAFAVLPGGLGTMDEAFEMLTWRQLGRHKKPIIFLDTKGYWQPFKALVAKIVDEGFAQDQVQRMFAFVEEPGEVLPRARLMRQS